MSYHIFVELFTLLHKKKIFAFSVGGLFSLSTHAVTSLGV